MKIVIDIPKDVYEGIISKGNYSTDFNLVKAFKNGIILPKGHGNLFDENDFEKRVAIMTESMDLGYGEIMDIVDEIVPIVEANKENTNE